MRLAEVIGVAGRVPIMLFGNDSDKRQAGEGTTEEEESQSL